MSLGHKKQDSVLKKQNVLCWHNIQTSPTHEIIFCFNPKLTLLPHRCFFYIRNQFFICKTFYIVRRCLQLGKAIIFRISYICRDRTNLKRAVGRVVVFWNFIHTIRGRTNKSCGMGFLYVILYILYVILYMLYVILYILYVILYILCIIYYILYYLGLI